MKQELFGGGMLNKLRGLLDIKNKLEGLGINFSEAADLLPALDSLAIAETAEQKLDAFQVLVKEFSEVTKTTVDDQISEALTQILQPGTIRDWVINLIESGLAEENAAEPGFILPMQAVPDPIVQELNFKNIDLDKIMEIVTFLVQIFAMFRK